MFGIKVVPLASLAPTDRKRMFGLVRELVSLDMDEATFWQTTSARYDRVILWESGGQLVGTIALRSIETEDAHFLAFGSVMVHSRRRGSGRLYAALFGEVLREWLAARGEKREQEVYLIGGTFSPFAYAAACRRIPTLVPRKGSTEQERRLGERMAGGMRAYVGEAIYRRFDPSRWVLEGTALAQKPKLDKEPDLDNPDVAYFIQRNPGYREGDALSLVIPVDPKGFALSAWRLAQQRLSKTLGK